MWFKIDDGFAFHPKALAAGNAALGLWVRAGAWCGKNLTDGYLPAHMIGTLGAQARDVRKLIEAGLWTEVLHANGTRSAPDRHTDGTQTAHEDASESPSQKRPRVRVDGYQFVDWEQWQPTKAQVKADREATKERVSRWRDQHRNAVTPTVTNAVTNGVTNGAPTRPDPTRSGLGSQSGLGRTTNGTSDRLDIAKIATQLGTDERWAERVARDVMARAPADVRDPQRYVEAAIRDRPADYRPTPTAPRLDQLCDHGRERATCPFEESA